MESLDPRLRNAPYFLCEKGDSAGPVCRKCETCVLAWKIVSTKEWFQRIGEGPQRRFLVSILEQLDSFYLLHYFQNILQTTQGKEFIYSRSRVNLSRKEGKIVRSSLNQMLDKTVEQKMREILYWFRRSTPRTKAKFTLSLLQMCDPKLLLTAASVTRVLFLTWRNNVAGKRGRRGTRKADFRSHTQGSGVWTSLGSWGSSRMQARVPCPHLQSCLPKEELPTVTSF